MNWVQRAVAAADLVSAQLSKSNTRCLRHPLQSLRIVRETATDAVITAHLEQAREDVSKGNREGFERHCEYAGQLARWHAPDRLDDIERLLETHSDRHTDSLSRR